jgi:glycerophosphoryl diester phosphodiesterase
MLADSPPDHTLFLDDLKDKALNIGHMGASGYEPENTFRSFKKALELGADGIELDVRMSKDGVLVVIHDPTVDRVTKNRHHGYVKDMTFEELKKLDVGKGERIPALYEVFEFFKDYKHIKIDIDLKESGLEDKVVDLIRQYNMENQIIVASFFPDSIYKIKRNNDDILTAFLCKSATKENVYLAKVCKADYIHPYYENVDAEFVKYTKEKGLQIYTWTVNDEKKISDFVKIVDGIITDYPDLYPYA